MSGKLSRTVLRRGRGSNSFPLFSYISTLFKQLLKELGVEQSFSSPGYPYDNAVVESFFRSIKTEELYKYNYSTRKELEAVINDYIKYYNDYRPHESLSNKTPNQFEKEYEKIGK